jgi:hypothetical protein
MGDAGRLKHKRAGPARDLDRRRKEAAAMADRYLKQYCRHSQVAKLAKAEDWIGPLTKFVRESAWVQAQILCRVDPIGWDASLADHLGYFSTSGEAYAAFRQTIAGAIERGASCTALDRSALTIAAEPSHHFVDHDRPIQVKLKNTALADMTWKFKINTGQIGPGSDGLRIIGGARGFVSLIGPCAMPHESNAA